MSLTLLRAKPSETHDIDRVRNAVDMLRLPCQKVQWNHWGALTPQPSGRDPATLWT